jgi:hypothetical protein
MQMQTQQRGTRKANVVRLPECLQAIRVRLSGVRLSFALLAASGACAGSTPTEHSRLGDTRAAAYGRVSRADGSAVAGATITSRNHLNTCTGNALAQIEVTTSSTGAYRIDMPTLPADSMCLILRADAAGVASSTDTVTVRRNTAVAPLVYDTVRVDFVLR